MILAQKTYEANKYKYEAKNMGRVYTPQVIQRRLSSSQGSRGSRGSRQSIGSRRPSSVAGSRNSSRMSNGNAQTMSLARLDEMDNNLPQIHPESSSRPSTSQSSPIKRPKNAHDMTAEELIEEIGRRGMTESLALQKQQLIVADNLKKKQGNVDYMDPDFDYEAMQKEDYYMPKVVITRPDGATLMDIYNSKRADTWSLILKTQLKEEEMQKVVDKRKKEEKNETYGRLLKEQLASNLLRDNGSDAENARLAAIVEATSKAKDDEQKKRKTDAIQRQKQFITHALEDIETKRVARESFLTNELEAAMKTNNKVKAAIAQDVLKKQKKKDIEAARLASLWDENQKELARKAELKRIDGEENLRIFRIGEERANAAAAKKKADLLSKLKASSDGPAHAITAKAKKLFRKQENEFYSTNEARDFMLNKQLMASETFNNSRGANIGATLLSAWDKALAIKEAKAKEDAERNEKILEYQRKQKIKNDKEDEEKRDAKRQAGLKYKHELDAQLTISRMRSQDALRKTMSDKERLYNSRLLMETGMIRSSDELDKTSNFIIKDPNEFDEKY